MNCEQQKKAAHLPKITILIKLQVSVEVVFILCHIKKLIFYIYKQNILAIGLQLIDNIYWDKLSSVVDSTENKQKKKQNFMLNLRVAEK